MNIKYLSNLDGDDVQATSSDSNTNKPNNSQHTTENVEGKYVLFYVLILFQIAYDKVLL